MVEHSMANEIVRFETFFDDVENAWFLLLSDIVHSPALKLTEISVAVRRVFQETGQTVVRGDFPR